MSEQLLTDNINLTAKVFETVFEYPVEQEILLADYDEQVFKILKTTVDCTVTQKYTTEQKLTIEGFFKITVFYQPPQTAHLTTVYKKIPFQKQFDTPVRIEKPYFVVAEGNLQYVNTRAVNSQRIDIRGIYGMSVKVYSQTKVVVPTAIDSSTVCTDKEEIEYYYMHSQGARQFSVEDELPVTDDILKIINITARNNNMTFNTYTDKVNVKGEILSDIAYISSRTQEVKHINKTFLYNQVVDVPGTIENSIPQIEFSLINCTVTQNRETQNVNCIITAGLDVKAFVHSNMILITDAFSKKYNYEKLTEKIMYDYNVIAVNKVCQFSIEDTVPDGYVASYSIADLSTPVMDYYDKKEIIKSKLSVSVVAQNVQNELECFSKVQDVNIDLGERINPDCEYLLSASVNDVNTVVSGNVMKVQVTALITGFVIKKTELCPIKQFTEKTDEELQNNENALIIYYAKKNEKVFDIAMKYRTDVETILKENQITGKEIAEDRMMVIPSFGM